MFLRKAKVKSGNIQLAIMRSYRDEHGKPKQKIVQYIGTLKELEKDYDDPIAHFTQVAKQMTEEQKQASRKVRISLSLDDRLLGSEDAESGITSSNTRKNLGYAVFSKIYHELELDYFLDNRRRYTKSGVNLEAIFRMLVYLRLLSPGSKKNSFENKGLLFDKMDFSLEDIYRALSFFNDNSREMMQSIHKRICKNYGRDTSLVYYDVTNYYFEIDDEDQLRKKGVSKEHRPDPIIQMGLFMDTDGIPVSYGLFEGNKLDKQTMIPMIHNVRSDYQLDRVIYVADKGMMCGNNIRHILSKGDGYVISYSIRCADKAFKGYVLQGGYRANKDGSLVKSRIYPREIIVTDLKGKRSRLQIHEKQVVFYSPKYAAKAKADRAKAVAKAHVLARSPGSYTRATSYGAAKYVRNIAFDRKTGEILESVKSLLEFDDAKLAEEEKYDGFYAIVSSELDCPADKIIRIYRGLWKIEETFKITKSDLGSRPVFLSTEEHIRAHFLICFVALVIARILEVKILNGQFGTSEILRSIRRYSCSRLEENYYLFDYYDEIIGKLGDVMGIDYNRRYMTLNEIRKILGKTKQIEG